MNKDDDMIERVARAAFKEAARPDRKEGAPWFNGLEWDDIAGALNGTNSFHDLFRDCARAAIEAMREPTHGMSRGYVRAHGYDPDAPSSEAPLLFGVGAVLEYQRWIDAALTPNEPVPNPLPSGE